MKTVTLSGFIKIDWSGSWQTIKLVQEDGYKIDLINRFKEAIESYNNSQVQVNYYLSDKACTKNEMLEGFLKKLYGYVEAEYEKNDYCYSSWTSGTDYDTTLKVGGHNLLSELSEEDGRFMIIELNFKDK